MKGLAANFLGRVGPWFPSEPSDEAAAKLVPGCGHLKAPEPGYIHNSGEGFPNTITNFAITRRVDLPCRCKSGGGYR